VLGINNLQSAIWSGRTVNGDSILVTYTWGGDADLNGVLDGDDYFAIDSHVLQDGVVFGFVNGDFDYDGHINGDDYFIIDSNFIAAQSGSMGSLATVPEPVEMSGIVLGFAALSRRRRV
jgi:hypothetical protein